MISENMFFQDVSLAKNC